MICPVYTNFTCDNSSQWRKSSHIQINSLPHLQLSNVKTSYYTNLELKLSIWRKHELITIEIPLLPDDSPFTRVIHLWKSIYTSCTPLPPLLPYFPTRASLLLYHLKLITIEYSTLLTPDRPIYSILQYSILSPSFFYLHFYHFDLWFVNFNHILLAILWRYQNWGISFQQSMVSNSASSTTICTCVLSKRTREVFFISESYQLVVPLGKETLCVARRLLLWERQVKITGRSDQPLHLLNLLDHHRLNSRVQLLLVGRLCPRRETWCRRQVLYSPLMAHRLRWQTSNIDSSRKKQTLAKSSWDQVFRQCVSSLEVTELALSLPYFLTVAAASTCRTLSASWPIAWSLCARRSQSLLPIISSFTSAIEVFGLSTVTLSSGHRGEQRPWLDTQLSSKFHKYFDNDAIRVRLRAEAAERRQASQWMHLAKDRSGRE